MTWFRNLRRAACRRPTTILIALLATSASADPLATRLPPAPGLYLVATRQVMGPVFGRSIVLLIDANEEGAVGLVVNRPSRFPLHDVFEELPASRDDPIYLGGPVEPRGMLLLVRTKRPPEDSRHIKGDVHLGQSADALRAMIRRGLTPDAMRAFVGYAGWSPGQLQFEIQRGDWFVIERDASLAFEARGDASWEKLVHSLESIRVRAPRPGVGDRGQRSAEGAASSRPRPCCAHDTQEPRVPSRGPVSRVHG